MTILTIVVLLLGLLVLGAPIGFALGIAGMVGLTMVAGLEAAVGVLATSPLSTVTAYELLTLPMFLLMAEFVIISRIADDLFDCIARWTGRLPGALAIATAFAGAGFGAISGSSTAGAATLSSVSLPAMLRHGYERKMANGVVAISGTLAMLIPPSIALILYGILTDLSIAKLLMAGVVPGIAITLLISATVLLLVFLDPSRAPAAPRYSWSEKFYSLRYTGPMLLLIAAVLGTIYMGIATPTEASAMGALGAFLITVARRAISPALLFKALQNASVTTAMIVIIIIGAHVFGYALTLTQATQSFIATIASLDLNRYVVLGLILLLKLLLGCFLDQVAILLLTVPIMVPLIVHLGFDPIWFGVILVVTAEVGMVTPPVGMNAFVVAKYTNQPVEDVFAGIWPHFIAHILAIIVLVAFPQIILWLPETMKG